VSRPARSVARLAIFVAVATVLQVAESLVPKPVPWLRLGLANAVTLLVLIRAGAAPAGVVTVVRLLLGGLVLGTLGSPAFLLSAALASCTVMTLNMYARRKRLPLESVRVDVQHGKIHAKDCLDCSSEDGKIDRFERAIYLQGDLSEEERQRLLEIADRCPVHRTLHGEIAVSSRLAD